MLKSLLINYQLSNQLYYLLSHQVDYIISYKYPSCLKSIPLSSHSLITSSVLLPPPSILLPRCYQTYLSQPSLSSLSVTLTSQLLPCQQHITNLLYHHCSSTTTYTIPTDSFIHRIFKDLPNPLIYISNFNYTNLSQ